jgi:hypothetical protein
MSKKKGEAKLLCDGLTREQITNRLCLWDLAVILDGSIDQDYLWAILTGDGYKQCSAMTDNELVDEYMGRDNLHGILDKDMPHIVTYNGPVYLPAWTKKLDLGSAHVPFSENGGRHDQA